MTTLADAPGPPTARPARCGTSPATAAWAWARPGRRARPAHRVPGRVRPGRGHPGRRGPAGRAPRRDQGTHRRPFGLNKASDLQPDHPARTISIVINNHFVLRVYYTAWLNSATLCAWIPRAAVSRPPGKLDHR